MAMNAMEPTKGDQNKHPDMVMCGDHPSVTNAELAIKEVRSAEKEKIGAPISYPRMTPTSRTECVQEPTQAAPAPSPSSPQRPDPLPASRALVQAALGSFRWPPYLVAAWAALLLAAHALHALLAALDAALPPLRKLCMYLRAWTEEMWHSEPEIGRKALPLALGSFTLLMYAVYGALFAVHAVTLWAIEPLCADLEERPSSTDTAKVMEYEDANTNFGLKY